MCDIFLPANTGNTLIFTHRINIFSQNTEWLFNPLSCWNVRRSHYSLTWLFCCWSLSCNIAWASPPVALLPAVSADSVLTTSSTPGAVVPLTACLSLKRPRLARTHMEYTDTADILNVMQLIHRARVERTNDFDWIRLDWLAGTVEAIEPMKYVTRRVLICNKSHFQMLIKVHQNIYFKFNIQLL